MERGKMDKRFSPLTAAGRIIGNRILQQELRSRDSAQQAMIGQTNNLNLGIGPIRDEVKRYLRLPSIKPKTDTVDTPAMRYALKD
jgi:hypothetical protein